MRVLIVSATELEIAPFLKKYPSADCLITGVGAAVSIYHLTKKIHQVEYDWVIQAGVAGAMASQISLGEVAVVSKDRFADIGAMEQHKWIDVFAQGLSNPNEYPFEEGWLHQKNIPSFFSHLPVVTAQTVNLLSDEIAHTQIITERYPAHIESMEGAALHYVCLQEKIPFVQVRAISNAVGERDKSKWKLQEAIQQLNKELVTAYESFIHSS